MDCTFTPSRCHVDLAALRRNFARLGEAASLMPVIKSDAYGHGLLPVASTLAAAGARRFAVGTVSEGVALRQIGLNQQILPLLGALSPEDWHHAGRCHLTLPLENEDDLRMAAQLTDGGSRLQVAIKCDTGMGRLGFARQDLPAVLETLRARPGLEPVLALSHLACADSPEEQAYTQAQAECFAAMSASLRAAFPAMERSLCNSAGTLGLSAYHYEACRVGLALYGGDPFGAQCPAAAMPELEWVMSVSAPVIRVRRLKTGQSLSYGRIFTAPRDMSVAVLAAGYATGVPRALSNNMDVLLDGRRVPQVGRICMSMLMVDVSSLPAVQAGDVAWILGGPTATGQRAVTAQELADDLDTIPYEILCRLGSENPRIYY